MHWISVFRRGPPYPFNPKGGTGAKGIPVYHSGAHAVVP
jgi:hypothetical protein